MKDTSRTREEIRQENLKDKETRGRELKIEPSFHREHIGMKAKIHMREDTLSKELNHRSKLKFTEMVTLVKREPTILQSTMTQWYMTNQETLSSQSCTSNTTSQNQETLKEPISLQETKEL